MTGDLPDYYTVLGVASTASPAEIAHAYRCRIRSQHPDTQPDTRHDARAEGLREVIAAYAVLRDPARRADYDQQRRSTTNTSPPPPITPFAPTEPYAAAACGFRPLPRPTPPRTPVTTTLAIPQPYRPAHPTHPAIHHRATDCRGSSADRECAVILMPITEHTDGPADDDVLHELAEHGLRHYTAQTANAVGVGREAAWCEWAEAPSAYIALDRRLPGHPDRDAALIWAAEHGWAMAVETDCGEDLLITASLGGDVLPSPDAVAAFVRRAVLADRHTDARACPRAAVDTNLARRLAGWAGHEPTVEGRTS